MEIFTRLAQTLHETDTALTNLMIFGLIGAQPAANEALRRVFGGIDFPVTWVEGIAHDHHPIAGVQAFAFSAGQVNPVRINGRVVGCIFDDDGLRHCLLGGLGPRSLTASRPDQLWQTLDDLVAALDRAGFSPGDIVRTWYYIDDLLAWYPDFNRVRTRAYARIQFRTGSLPASTGISARNPDGAALVAGAWAVQPLDSCAKIAEIPSPLQCPAPAYGSSFSRAMEISSRQGRRLLISGTASIAPEGQTVWPGNVGPQIDLTMEVVEAILTSRGLAFSDIVRATAYFKERVDIQKFHEWCDRYRLPALPVIAAQCGICRDDLLFEIEADAWKATSTI